MTASQFIEFMLGVSLFAVPAYVCYAILCVKKINRETTEIENSY